LEALSFFLMFTVCVMKITSPAFADKIPVPLQYTCKGSNQSPPLEFIDVPKETVTLALVVEDLDAHTDRIRWLVYNIPGKCTHFDEGKVPEEAISGIRHGGGTEYDGPSPGTFKGIHRFSYKLYALDNKLEVPAIADAEVVLSRMNGHILETAELIGVAEGEQVSESVS
jgi:Raf kinase inhibitor-like YbhB/YbcL family protein